MIKRKDFEQLLDQDVSIAATANSVSDWILDAAISQSDETSCVLITAHNTVLRASMTENRDEVTLEELHSPSQSILYSAHLVWEAPDRVLVAAGTVFGEIIIWQCAIPKDRTVKDGQVLFTFTGHEGSIFGVNISPPVLHPNGTISRLLASCSDDRTIRVWDLARDSEISQQVNDLILPRETGFGDNEIHGREQSYNRCVAMAMGHASRIWRVKFIMDGSSVNALSFGEDSTTQQWELGFGTGFEESGTLSQMNTFAFHSGKHIWCAATYRMDGGDSALASGGADGKISLYDIDMPPTLNVEDSSRYCTPSGIWDLEEILGTFSLDAHVPEPEAQPQPQPEEPPAASAVDGKLPKRKKAKKVPKDAFNRYAFVSEDRVLVTTTYGRVLLGHISTSIKWEELLLPESNRGDLKSYAIVEGIPEIGLAYLAGANGKIYAYHGDSTLLEVGNVEGKIADMFKVVNPETKDFQLLITTLTGGFATLFSIEASSSRFSSQQTYNLPEKFVITSAGMTGGLLLLGSRNGSLAVFDPQRPECPASICTSEDSSPGDAITTIIPLPTPFRTQVEGRNYLLTTGRNGMFSIFSMSISDSNIHPIHHGTPPFGPMIENAWFSGRDLILYGFKGKNFIVWNETRQCQITNVDCGGAHRSYAYSPLNNSSGGHFVYTKASKLCLQSQQKPSHSIIKPGGHGREIKACAVSPDRSLIATGAEDTAIRIWRYQDDGKSELENKFDCQAIIHKHTAGIQHLQWRNSNYLFTSGGNEEFFIWAISTIPGFGIGVVCEASCPDQSAERDLRIMSFDVTALSSPSSDNGNEEKSLISLAYSDSTICAYTYTKTTGFTLIATGRYTSSCLMQLRHIQTSAGDIRILTAATDGNLTLWKCPLSKSATEIAELIMLSTRKVHQSSIKSLDMATSTDKQQVVSANPQLLPLSIWLSQCLGMFVGFKVNCPSFYFDIRSRLSERCQDTQNHMSDILSEAQARMS